MEQERGLKMDKTRTKRLPSGYIIQFCNWEFINFSLGEWDEKESSFNDRFRRLNQQTLIILILPVRAGV